MNSVACDNWGNPLGVGGWGSTSNMYYFDIANDTWFELDMPDSVMINLNSVDFNTNDYRFYAVGEYSTQSVAMYTDDTKVVPLTNSNSSYQDSSAFMIPGPFNGISWNQLHDYALVTSSIGLFKMGAYSGNGSLSWSIVDTVPCNDIAWDIDGWNEAAIVGGISGDPSYTYYWGYYDSNPTLILGYTAEEEPYQCVSIKPPASPKLVFIP